MRLFRLTLATIFQRKAWIITLLVVCALPFGLAQLSSGTENPALMKPALAQATWAMAWLTAVCWGLFAAASLGDRHVEHGTGEYFQSQGISPTRQLAEIWLAVLIYVVPLALGAALVSIAGASPALADERGMWITLNFQYALLFILALAPLLALATALASRFGAICGFVLPAFLIYYGLYGVGYLQLSAKQNLMLQWLADYSPHYHLADLTPRLRYKMGSIDWHQFPILLAYFGGLLLIQTGFARLLFRTKTIA